MEIIGRSIKGFYRDILKGADDRLLYDSGWVSNTIVDRCRILLAGFVRNDPLYPTQGIQYLAVGQGLEAWDAEGVPALKPQEIQEITALINQYEPAILLKELDVVYLDDGDEAVTDPTPTNRLQITATLGPGYPDPAPRTTYPLRNFGLFGRFAGEDYMINCVRHPVIHKDASATLIRVIRLYF
jgi:hypothetical protein